MNGLVAADFDDDVAVLEALDRRVVHLADALAELGEHVLPFGLADLLEDHLLGGLCGDSPKDLGRLRKLHLVAELDAVRHLVAIERSVHLARFVKRNLGRGSGHLVDNGLQRKQIDLSGFGVEPRLQVLARSVVLAGGGCDRLLDGADDDIGLDPFLFRESLDGLLQRIRHLKFHFQIRARDDA